MLPHVFLVFIIPGHCDVILIIFVSSVHNTSAYSGFFKDFLFFIAFKQFIYDVPWYVFLCLLCLGFVEFVGVSSIRKVSGYFSK